MRAASAAPAFMAGGAVLAAVGAWLIRASRVKQGESAFVSILSSRQLAITAGWVLVGTGVLLAAIIGPGLWFGYH